YCSTHGTMLSDIRTSDSLMGQIEWSHGQPNIHNILRRHVMNILQINSSARVEGSHSTALANDIVARLRATHPAAEVIIRDLARTPHPVLDETALQALFTPPEQRSPEQAA